MIKGFIKFAVAAVFSAALAVSAAAQNFTDVSPEHWAYTQINEFSEKGIVNGDGNGLFRPYDGVTREEFSKMLCETFNYYSVDISTLEEPTYSDVTPERWSYKYVENCIDYLPGAENGGTKLFSPSEPALRDDLAAAVVKMMGYTKSAVSDREYAKTAFSDGAAVKEALLPYVSIAVEKGIVNGYPDGTFLPGKGITRAEAVVLLGRAFEKYENGPVTIDEAMKIIDDIVPPTERDIKIAYTLHGYNLTYSEIDYRLKNCVDTVALDSTDNTAGLEELRDLINTSCNIFGTVYKLASENGIFVTMKEFRAEVIGILQQIRYYYGDKAEDLIDSSLGTTLNYVLDNAFMSIYSSKLLDSRFAYGSEKYKAILGSTVEAYEEYNYIRAKHILIGFPYVSPTPEEKQAAYKKAEEVLAKAKAGTDFDALIAEYNEDPGMASNPYGYLFAEGMMVAPFEKAAYALDEGEISGIVETSYGYHIIKRVPIGSADMSEDKIFTSLAKTDYYMWLKKEMENVPYAVVKDLYSEETEEALPEEGTPETETEDPKTEDAEDKTEEADEEYKIDLLEYLEGYL